MVAELLSNMFWSFWNLATWMVIVFPPDKPMATWSLFSELTSFDLFGFARGHVQWSRHYKLVLMHGGGGGGSGGARRRRGCDGMMSGSAGAAATPALMHPEAWVAVYSTICIADRIV